MYSGRVVVPLFAFFDDLETGNSVGSHSGGQKFGCVDIFLPTLPPHLRAKLKYTILTTIFHSDTRKISENEVFRRLVNELNILSQNGLEIVVEGKTMTVFFQLVCLLVDNLGLNQICGFPESFTANYYCRILSNVEIGMLVYCRRKIEKTENFGKL